MSRVCYVFIIIVIIIFISPVPSIENDGEDDAVGLIIPTRSLWGRCVFFIFENKNDACNELGAGYYNNNNNKYTKQ